MTKTCIIVDGYSTGSKLASGFKKNNYSCIHVRSSTIVPSIYTSSFNPQDYYADLIFESSNAFFHNISVFKPSFIVAGTETGVAISDTIGKYLHLKTHDPLKSKARRDKFSMIEELRKKNIRHINSLKTNNLLEAEKFIDSIGFPVVTKPLTSAGSDNVMVCEDSHQFKLAWETTLHSVNMLGDINDYLLIQEFIDGQQFIINSISIAGKHYITEMWQDDRVYISGGGVAYDKELLLNHKDIKYQLMQQYVVNCLDALGFYYGPAHSEIIVDKNGPVLIETAARMQGSINDDVVQEALGYSHVSLTIGCFTNPEGTIEILEAWESKKKELMCISLISKHEGIVIAESGLATIRKIPTVCSVLHTPVAGDYLRKTIDLFTSPGIIYVIADDNNSLSSSYVNIRNIEKFGLFELCNFSVGDKKLI